MSQPYDATGKELIEFSPSAWLEFFGIIRPAEIVSVIDADISSVTAAADKVIRIGDPQPWLLHIELQSSRNDRLPARMAMYHAILAYRHECPVASVVLLLRPQADSPGMTGFFEVTPPFGPPTSFGYRVVRLWQIPLEHLLEGPVVWLPFAPVVAKPEQLSDVLSTVRGKLSNLPTEEKTKLWAAIYLMLGLQYQKEFINTLMGQVMWLEDSSTYQYLIQRGKLEGNREGKREEVQNLLFRIGKKKYGPPGPAVVAKVDAEQDLERLESMFERVLDANSWDDLLAGK